MCVFDKAMSLREVLAREKKKVFGMWHKKCDQLENHEGEQKAMDSIIGALRAELATQMRTSLRTLNIPVIPILMRYVSRIPENEMAGKSHTSSEKCTSN